MLIDLQPGFPFGAAHTTDLWYLFSIFTNVSGIDAPSTTPSRSCPTR